MSYMIADTNFSRK